jgi:uncharacterized protein YllA (UPF0747 family)
MSSTINCEVIKSFRAPKRNGKDVIYKEFTKGQRVKGGLVDDKMFQTFDGFIVPKSNLRPIMSNASGEEEAIEYAEVIEDKSKTLKMPVDIKNNMGDFFKTKSKIAVQGAVVGLVVGFAYALAKGKSKIIFSAIGSIGGFVVGNLYNNFINEEKK